MKKLIPYFSFLAVTVCACQLTFSQDKVDMSPAVFNVTDSLTKNGLTLIFINKDTGFSMVTKQRMIDAHFEVYPKLMERFNKEARKKVTFIVDPEYKGVAAAGNGVVRFNPKWMKDHPSDIDVVTHEVMHIIQSYGNSGGPGWLTEGIADYVRNHYGIANKEGGWAMPEYNEKHKFNNSYRITARFLTWLEKNKNPNIVNELDAAMRSHSYDPEIWKKLTGKSVEELWEEYAKNPGL